jgi:hypothetical protein
MTGSVSGISPLLDLQSAMTDGFLESLLKTRGETHRKGVELRWKIFVVSTRVAWGAAAFLSTTLDEEDVDALAYVISRWPPELYRDAQIRRVVRGDIPASSWSSAGDDRPIVRSRLYARDLSARGEALEHLCEVLIGKILGGITRSLL